MSAFVVSSSLPGDVSSEDLLRSVLDVSLTGIQLLRPVYAPDGPAIVDFAFAYTNPAGLRISGVSQPLGGTLLGTFPHTRAAGVLAYYQRAFEASEPLAYEANYQADGLDNYLRFRARRSGEHLLVSFTDTSDQPRSAVETALRQSQAAEQAARVEAETQRQRFHDVLMQLPAQVALNRGPNHVFELVNAPYQQLFSTRAVQGLPVRQALPELAGQQFFELLDQVYQTGEPFYSRAMPASVDFTNSGRLERRYADVFFQALHDAHGHVDGILNFSYDVTEQVLARQQVQTLNEELAAINEELRASNEEYQQANLALSAAQRQLRQLNQELEVRVQARTHEALALQAELLAAAQRQVQARESFYQVFEQTPAAVSLLRGPSYCFDYVNPVYQQVFAGRQLVGRDFADALPDAAAQGYLALLDGVYQTGETFFGAEVPFVSEQPDAPTHTTYFNFTYQAYRENGEIVGISTFALDVTEQVLARREREVQQQQLTSVFEQAPAGIWVVQGPAYVFERINPAMAQMLGRPAAQVLGRPYFEVMAELVGQGLPELFRRVWEQGEPVYVEELAMQLAHHAPGEVGYYTFVFQPLRDEHGQVTRISCVALDVTTQVQARQQVQNLNEELAAINEELQASNEELNASNRQLTRTNVDLDNFIYTASHDLKAPISNIEGLLLALAHELPPVSQVGDVPLMLKMMQEAIERFGRTIGHLTDVARLQNEHAQPAAHLSLARVVQEVQLDLAPLLTQTAAHLRVDVPESALLLFSEKNLRSVVYNLLSNALKYRHPDRVPAVRVVYRPEAQYQVLEVQDNGLGLDLARGQHQLFAMFQRLHTHVEGTGLGLYMVKKIVENAGGRLEVESQLGLGSTFRVYFPR